jgi:hypothetical protein
MYRLREFSSVTGFQHTSLSREQSVLDVVEDTPNAWRGVLLRLCQRKLQFEVLVLQS